MRIVVFATAVSATFALGCPGAGAASFIPLASDSAAPAVTLVAQGCGLGYSRGAYGRCRSSVFGFGSPRGYGRGYGYGYGYGGYPAYGYGYRPYRYGY